MPIIVRCHAVNIGYNNAYSFLSFDELTAFVRGVMNTLETEYIKGLKYSQNGLEVWMPYTTSHNKLLTKVGMPYTTSHDKLLSKVARILGDPIPPFSVGVLTRKTVFNKNRKLRI